MKKITTLILIISFLGMNCAKYELGNSINLEPDQKPGIKLVIHEKDGQQVRGELITVKNHSSLLMKSQSGEDVLIDVGDIQFIYVVKKSSAWSGASIGFLIGAATGGIIFGAMASDWDVDNSTGSVILLAGLFGATLAIPGALIGAYVGIDKKIKFEGKSDSEIKKILEDLRKKARVPEFQ